MSLNVIVHSVHHNKAKQDLSILESNHGGYFEGRWPAIARHGALMVLVAHSL